MYYWFPKMTGRFLGDRLGKWQFWIMLIGFNLAFFPMHILGLRGMPRRIADYAPDRGWTGLNRLSTVGAFIIAMAMIIFFTNDPLPFASRGRPRRRVVARDTLEWATSSPPPPHNFDSLPPIHSDRPVYDLRMAQMEAES